MEGSLLYKAVLITAATLAWYDFNRCFYNYWDSWIISLFIISVLGHDHPKRSVAMRQWTCPIVAMRIVLQLRQIVSSVLLNTGQALIDLELFSRSSCTKIALGAVNSVKARNQMTDSNRHLVSILKIFTLEARVSLDRANGCSRIHEVYVSPE